MRKKHSNDGLNGWSDPSWSRSNTGEDRHVLLGPGIGHRRTDRFFDLLGTVIILGVGVVATVGLLRILPSVSEPQPMPVRPSSTIPATEACQP